MTQKRTPVPGRLGAAVFAAALALAFLDVTGGTARAATSPARSTPADQAVTFQVGTAAQAAASSFWTRASMESATPVTGPAATPKAVMPGTTAPPAATPSAATPGAATPSATEPPGVPNPVYFNGVPTVGALFSTTGSQKHFCTASAVQSLTFDLILTAAHCVFGGSTPSTNIAYAPEWHQGISPYGLWPVKSVTVAAGWQESHDVNLDFAFLAVTPPTGQRWPLQFVTGGLRLGINTGYAHNIYVIGYNDTDDQPIGCATASFYFETDQMEFYCNSYWDGTSGGPWITHYNPYTGSGVLIGDIGGYEQGGDYPWASYSAYYTWSILQLFTETQLQQL
jgi:hypothetical protein